MMIEINYSHFMVFGGLLDRYLGSVELFWKHEE